MPLTPACRELFLHVAQQHGDVESLLESFFGFLHEQTDFYSVSKNPRAQKMGFLRGAAEQMVLKAFRKYPMKDLDATVPSNPAQEKQPTAPTPAPTPVPTPPAVASKAAITTPKPTVQYTEEGKQIPIGNGGITAKYSWTQTLDDVTVYVDLPEHVTAKQLQCEISCTRVSAKLKTTPLNQRSPASSDDELLGGQLYERIRTDESLWSIENGRVLTISLEKTRRTWWASVFKGDPEIDTSKVDSTQRIDHYDPETQGALRKVMFDQTQKAQGKPTSDELLKENILKNAWNLPNSPFTTPPRQQKEESSPHQP